IQTCPLISRVCRPTWTLLGPIVNESTIRRGNALPRSPTCPIEWAIFPIFEGFYLPQGVCIGGSGQGGQLVKGGPGARDPTEPLRAPCTHGVRLGKSPDISQVVTQCRLPCSRGGSVRMKSQRDPLCTVRSVKDQSQELLQANTHSQVGNEIAHLTRRVEGP